MDLFTQEDESKKIPSGMEGEKKEQETPEVETPRKIYVTDLQIGDSVDTYFVVTRMTLREYDRGKFLNLRLADQSGKISAVLWNGAEVAQKEVKEGCLVSATGKVNTYQNEPQITLKSIRRVECPEDLDSRDFLPASPRRYEELVTEFDQILQDVTDEHYRVLLYAFRNDEESWPKFSHAPAAKLWHHPYIHGLLEHTVSVVKLCQQIGSHYLRVNKDLLMTGAVFHDAGKCIELVYDYRIDYSTEGRLLGHIYLGTQMAEKLMSQIPDFPEEKRRQLLHIILSHHGDTERSPVLPMTLEANLLHFIENMDAQEAALEREMDKVKGEGNTWTGFINLIQRFLYLGELNNEEQTNEESDEDESKETGEELESSE